MPLSLGTEARSLRVAIIGAGPAGFFAADALLKREDLSCSIDIFNKFPTPHGLVREGVAPDHQKIKNVIRIFDRTASHAGVRYLGNVTFGEDVTHDDLMQYYDQVVYAVGAQADRRLGIPGEDLEGSSPATIFVGWYNAHPDYCDLNFDLSGPTVVVVGNGNVAVDVARVLVRSRDELATTDIADDALADLRECGITEVVMLGRRGPAQGKFTSVELKEFGALDGVDVIVDPADLELDPDSEAALSDNKVARKNVEILREFATREPASEDRRIVLRFLASPVEILGEDGQVTGVRIERNRLVREPNGYIRSEGTGEFSTIETNLVLRSVGYRGIPLPGVPFDEKRNIIRNVGGRVVDDDGTPLPGEYVVGWAKRGPSGIIGTNKPDAVATVDAMMEDLPSIAPVDETRRDPDAILQLLQERGVDVVTFEDWKRLDDYEVECGEAEGRPRVKVPRVAEMMQVIRDG